jgi:hypothetical protein
MVPAASLCTERTENPVQTIAMNIGTHPEGRIPQVFLDEKKFGFIPVIVPIL